MLTGVIQHHAIHEPVGEQQQLKLTFPDSRHEMHLYQTSGVSIVFSSETPGPNCS